MEMAKMEDFGGGLFGDLDMGQRRYKAAEVEELGALELVAEMMC